jgi:hypothetical protein
MDQPTYETPLEAQVVDDPPQGGWREAVDNPWLVLVTLFCITAALGLPLLWMSRAFSRRSKTLLSIVVVLYTGLLFWVFWIIMYWSYTQIRDAL